jgi:hypothetical protein
LGQVDLVEVARDEARPPGHARLRRPSLRLRDERAIDVHAERACAELSCRRDDDAPIARAEVDDQVARTDLGEREHLLDDLMRRRHVGVVEDLALGGGLRPRRAERDRKREQCGEPAHRSLAHRPPGARGSVGAHDPAGQRVALRGPFVAPGEWRRAGDGELDLRAPRAAALHRARIERALEELVALLQAQGPGLRARQRGLDAPIAPNPRRHDP